MIRTFNMMQQVVPPCLVLVSAILSVLVTAQNCPNHCLNCNKRQNGDVIKATCTDVTNSEIPDTIQELLMINGGQYALPKLRSYFFANKNDLTILRIQNYHLRGLQGPSFQGCPNLELLDLSGNNLYSVSADNFDGLTKLTYLSLDTNSLQDIGNSTFKHLTALEELHLAHNEITNLKEANFKGLFKIKKIYLEFNKISSIDKAFNGLMDLEEIHLEGNLLTAISVGWFDTLLNLKILDLKSNHIRHIDPTCLDNVPLTYLNLMQNKLQNIPTEFLQHISNISLEVSLAQNNITDISEGELQEVNLASLTLLGNDMNYIHPDALCESYVEKLDFQQNMLTHFPQGLQQYLNQSNTVLLGNNPWSCDCDIQWVMSLLRPNIQEPVCSQPASYRGQPLSQIINDIKLTCNNNQQLPVPTRNIPIPPKQKEVTPQLAQKSTKCFSTTTTKPRKSQKSYNKDNTPYLAIILGVVFGLLVLITLIIVLFVIHKKKSNVAPELKMECRKPDLNYRPHLSQIPLNNNFIV